MQNCGDWHLGWGFGGHDKVGKLSKNEDGTFTWRGRSQGRHMQTWNHGAFLHFELQNDEIKVLDSKGSWPVNGELINGVNELLAKELAFKNRKQRSPLKKNVPDNTPDLFSQV